MPAPATYRVAVFVVILTVSALACIITGIYLLAGLPWALIAAGCVLMGAGALLRTGMTADG